MVLFCKTHQHYFGTPPRHVASGARRHSKTKGQLSKGPVSWGRGVCLPGARPADWSFARPKLRRTLRFPFLPTLVGQSDGLFILEPPWAAFRSFHEATEIWVLPVLPGGLVSFPLLPFRGRFSHPRFSSTMFGLARFSVGLQGLWHWRSLREPLRLVGLSTDGASTEPRCLLRTPSVQCWLLFRRPKRRIIPASSLFLLAPANLAY